MIRHNCYIQCLECLVCGEATELRRNVSADPEKVFLLKEALEVDHAPCEEWMRTHPDGTARAAQLNREFYVRVREELKKSDGKNSGEKEAGKQVEARRTGRLQEGAGGGEEARTRPERFLVIAGGLGKAEEAGKAIASAKAEGRRVAVFGAGCVNKCQARAA